MAEYLRCAINRDAAAQRRPARGLRFLQALKTICLGVMALSLMALNAPAPARQTYPGEMIPANAIGEAANAPVSVHSVSADGRFILLSSSATNFDSISTVNLYLYDRKNAQLQPIRLAQGQNFESVEAAALSADGRFIVFEAEHEGVNQIFRHDLLADQTELASRSEDGAPAQNGARSPSISANGRHIGFVTLANNLTFRKAQPGLNTFIHDFVTGHNFIASGALAAESEINSQQAPRLASDGRALVYLAQNQIVYYNRVLDTTRYHDYTQQGAVLSAWDVSQSAKITVYALCRGTRLEIFRYELGQNAAAKILEGAGCEAGPISLSLSADGAYLALNLPAQNGQHDLIWLETDTGAQTRLAEGVAPGKIAITADGQTVIYPKNIGPNAQLFVWTAAPQPAGVIWAGQVRDASGEPLALVTAANEDGVSTRTDEGGYFWLPAVHPAARQLTVSKEGYQFEPESVQLEAASDQKAIAIVYSHDKTLKEARKDLGMPYSFARGTQGPFHGYAAGYCTDLVLDAYTWGAEFDIQFALEHDFRAQPWHFYRWRDARNAHDMWRYFNYSGQMLPHASAYLPGDIVFFDWTEDGEIDHVAVISVVTDDGRPEMMYDASGVINSNPSGLAAELPWEPFHEATVRGKARWNGQYEPVIPELPGGERLQLALSGANLNLDLLQPGQVEMDIGADDPFKNRRDHWGWETTINLEFERITDQQQYLVVVVGAENPAYQISAQFISAGVVTGRVEASASLTETKVKSYYIILQPDPEGTIQLSFDNPKRIEGTFSEE